MSQSTLDDDLFGEAAEEVTEDVQDALADAKSELPDADAIWSVEASNVLGMLNALRSALDVESAEEHLREAKKWYTLGRRADAFSDGDDLESEIEAIESLIETVESAEADVGKLATTMPELRGALESIDDGATVIEDETAETDSEEAEAA